MATMSVPRVPFGELKVDRVQGLASIKNQQNFVTQSLKSSTFDKAKVGSKRARSSAFDDEEFDAENIDPLQAGPKRTKADDGSVFQKAKPAFSLCLKGENPAKKSELKNAQPITGKKIKSDSCSTTAPFGCHTAPAGRSPPSKRATKKRGLYTRIDPPGSRSGKSASTRDVGPLSIDAALTNIAPSTSSRSNDDVVPMKKSRARCKPVEVLCDSPIDDVSNKLGARALDLSDKNAQYKDVGKENVAPPDYEAVRPRGNNLRRRVSAELDKMIDTDHREALEDLIAADFYSEGLSEHSVELVDTDYIEPVVGENTGLGESLDSAGDLYGEEL